MKGQVLHRERAHLKVPDWSLVLNELLTKKLHDTLSTRHFRWRARQINTVFLLVDTVGQLETVWINKGIINSLEMRLLKVKCAIICRQILLYLFVSRRAGKEMESSTYSQFIHFLFIFPFFRICHFRFWLMRC